MPATIVVGLGFGDEGKGSIVDYLVRRDGAAAVVRFNGGAQCAHHVVAPDGREHTFAQFGAGTFVPGVETILSKHVLVNPLNLLAEEAHLREQGVTDALDRLHIDPDAIVITPPHVAVNRLREGARGEARHGSCGQGIGEARSGAILGRRVTLRAGDLRDERKVVEAISRIAGGYIEEFGHAVFDTMPPWEELLAAYQAAGERVARAEIRPRIMRLLDAHSVVFEGAQGILLDERFGISPPHVTWTDTTARNALDLIGRRPARIVGVTRAYLTRHGPGPLPGEHAGLTMDLQDDTNPWNEWQGPLRVAPLSEKLLRYASRVQRIDEVAINHLDRVPDDWAPIEVVEYGTGAPVTILGYGPAAGDKLARVDAELALAADRSRR